mmetsp:Transcript_17465/g.49862  ORF Transcript_17465/g.49862 Transcript_17465/m.49862 type:complete len:330 (-) Transcript_17465:391-1380(-)
MAAEEECGGTGGGGLGGTAPWTAAAASLPALLLRRRRRGGPTPSSDERLRRGARAGALPQRIGVVRVVLLEAGPAVGEQRREPLLQHLRRHVLVAMGGHHILGHVEPLHEVHRPPRQRQAREDGEEHPDEAPDEAVPIPWVARERPEDFALSLRVVWRDEVRPDPCDEEVVEGAELRVAFPTDVEPCDASRGVVQELVAVRHHHECPWHGVDVHRAPRPRGDVLAEGRGRPLQNGAGQGRDGGGGGGRLVEVEDGDGAPGARAVRAGGDLGARVRQVHVSETPHREPQLRRHLPLQPGGGPVAPKAAACHGLAAVEQLPQLVHVVLVQS